MRGRIQPPAWRTASTGVAPRAYMGPHVPRFTPSHLTLLPRSGPDEYLDGFRTNAVELHCISRLSGLHHLLEGVMSGTSTIKPTRLVFAGSMNVRPVMPRGPKSSSRLGEASQCSTSSTSWKIITVVIVASAF